MTGKRILVCLTGASGAIYGVKLIQTLSQRGHEVQLIVSKWGHETLSHETGLSVEDLKKYAEVVYDETDLTAGPASGSYHLDAMAIVPCSMKTLAGIANGYADNLVGRAADCALKERRPLVIVPRETPLNLIHIRNMERVTEAGAILLPASPAFWHKPENIDQLVDSIVDRIIPHLGLSRTEIEWTGDI
ncbi:MAG: Flavin prenyltransferase UbiX [Candidatus Thorarchaeota archaeon]|nr:MAG: Flavin prenyltransferase UbiX [Candidatus Thorarchaeota archaeon]